MSLTAKAVILGEPASPYHQINPVELVRYLETLDVKASLTGAMYFEDTLANLNAVVSPAVGDTGFVIYDAVSANNGVYRYETGGWVKTSELPPGFDASVIGKTGFVVLQQTNLPGDVPQNFSGSLEGEFEDAPVVPGDIVATAAGSVLRLTGANLVGTRERFKIDVTKRYAVRWKFVRSTNPTDPIGDAVRIGIAFLDGSKQLIAGGKVVLNTINLFVADGAQDFEYLLFEGASAPFTLDFPDGAVYMVPYFETFGLDGVTDLLEMGWSENVTRVARTFYVTMDGNDDNIGSSLSSPLATITEAISRMAASAPLPCITIVHPGEYLVPPDQVIPSNCALYGYDLRVTKLILANSAGTAAAVGAERKNNIFQMTSGIKVRGFTFTGLEHNIYEAGVDEQGLRFDPVNELFNVPNKGWAFVFKPGELITRSPYISDCSMLHDLTQEQMVLPINRQTGNPDMPIGGGNILADGSVLDPDSPLRSVVVDSFTSINPNGVAYAITRNAFVQLVSVFTNWSRVGLWSHEGGQVTIANSNNTFGDYALAATGFRYAVLIPDPTTNISEQDAAATIIDSNFEAIITDVMGRYQTLPGWSVGYNELAERDTRTLLRAIANDLRSGQSRAMQYFTKGLFNWNADFAFNRSLVPLFILSWQEVEVELYDRIVSIPARNMITTLIDMAQAVAQDIYTRQNAGTPLIDSPYITTYNSVVEATGQQFSYAGSGVNYNSLPFSQRGTGTAPDPTSAIVKANGGRIYATFSTEVGDTYLGEDLRVDFERSTIEGQAFSRGVQNITLPLTIALGG